MRLTQYESISHVKWHTIEVKSIYISVSSSSMFAINGFTILLWESKVNCDTNTTVEIKAEV